MRVLHLGAGNLYGGIETMLVTLARHRHLCPAMEPHFGLCFDGQLGAELRATSAPVHLLGGVRVSRPATVLRARRALAALLAHGGFDVVVSHGSWTHALFAPVVRRTAATLVFWLHGVAEGRDWLERWARRARPDLVIANSRFTAGSAERLYSGVRTEVVHPPVAAPAALPAGDRARVREELGTAQDATVIVQVSRMEAWKGHRLHLHALARLDRALDWVCWLVGGAQRPAEAAYERDLRALAVRLGIADRVRFVGQRDDVVRLLRAADVHCQPNLGPEPFGITFVEGLASGLPVVTTAIGAAPEIVDATCGVLVAAGDVDALAVALGTLIASPGERRILGMAGPARARALCDPARQIEEIRRACAPVGVGVATFAGTFRD